MMDKRDPLEVVYRHHVSQDRRQNASRMRVLQQFPDLQKSFSAGRLVTGDRTCAVIIQGQKSKRNGGKKVYRNPSKKFLGVSDGLLRSSMAEINALETFKTDKLTKPKYFLEEQSTRELEEQKMQDPKESALRKVRDVAEKFLESQRYDLDLRGFEGAALTPEELRIQMRSQFGLRLTKPEVKALVEHLDDNNDGYIQYSEIIRKFYNPELLQVRKERKKWHRSALDRFRMTIAKIKEAVHQRGCTLEQLFEKYDQDGNHSLSKEEFISFLLDDLGANLHEREVEQVFDVLDPNGDGDLKFSEFSFAYYNYRSFEAQLAKKESQSKRQRPPFRV